MAYAFGLRLRHDPFHRDTTSTVAEPFMLEACLRHDRTSTVRAFAVRSIKTARTAPHLSSLADGTSVERRRSSRPRTPSSRRPPVGRDGERVGVGGGAGIRLKCGASSATLGACYSMTSRLCCPSVGPKGLTFLRRPWAGQPGSCQNLYYAFRVS